MWFSCVHQHQTAPLQLSCDWSVTLKVTVLIYVQLSADLSSVVQLVNRRACGTVVDQYSTINDGSLVLTVLCCHPSLSCRRTLIRVGSPYRSIGVNNHKAACSTDIIPQWTESKVPSLSKIFKKYMLRPCLQATVHGEWLSQHSIQRKSLEPEATDDVRSHTRPQDRSVSHPRRVKDRSSSRKTRLF
ncbi:hypothetical protein J6590_028943 [Homalodisca vitripennis]|nr:hypothetical protein J6590_028943 [Homalodisca vitripennis]